MERAPCRGAIALAVTGVGVLYIAVQLVAQGILGRAPSPLPRPPRAPLAAAAVQFAGQTGATLILIAMIVSTFGFMTATMLATPRTLFAFAVDGYLPRPLARVHQAHHTPYRRDRGPGRDRVCHRHHRHVRQTGDYRGRVDPARVPGLLPSAYGGCGGSIRARSTSRSSCRPGACYPGSRRP